MGELSLNNNYKQIARTAGVLYFIFLLIAPLGYMYLPAEIIKSNDITATAVNVLNNQSLFRLGILLTIFGQIIYIFLALQLHKLFSDVNKTLANVMVVLVVCAAPIAIFNEVFYVGVLHVLKNPDYLQSFSYDQLKSIALLMANLRDYGTIIAGFFWGLWLLPFGWLIIKSNFMPKILGYLLLLGGLCYMFDSSIAIMYPAFRASVTNVLLLPLSVGEISTIFYLLIKGCKQDEPNQ